MTQVNWFLCVLHQDLENPLTRTQREDFEYILKKKKKKKEKTLNKLRK